MVVVDTDVVSELMRRVPDPTVLAWASRVTATATTAVTVAEVRWGVRRLPEGRRKDELSVRAH